MKTSLYYYNVHPNEFKDLPYKDALQFKLKAAKELLKSLVQYNHYTVSPDTRIKAVQGAISDTEKLISELAIPTNSESFSLEDFVHVSIEELNAFSLSYLEYQFSLFR